MAQIPVLVGLVKGPILNRYAGDCAIYFSLLYIDLYGKLDPSPQSRMQKLVANEGLVWDSSSRTLKM